MTTPPSFNSATATVMNSTASPKTTASIAVTNGDVLVASAFGENSGGGIIITIATATGSTSGWTLKEENGPFADINHSYVRTWTATATATGNITVTFTRTVSATQNFGGYVAAFSGSDGIGNINRSNNDLSSGSPTITRTTSGANSALVYASADWNATAGTVTFTASAGTPVQDVADQAGAGSIYCVYASHLADAGATGSKTMGMSSPSTQRYLATIIEVLGTTAVAFTGCIFSVGQNSNAPNSRMVGY